jgi:hypothetical protein
MTKAEILESIQWCVDRRELTPVAVGFELNSLLERLRADIAAEAEAEPSDAELAAEYHRIVASTRQAIEREVQRCNEAIAAARRGVARDTPKR